MRKVPNLLAAFVVVLALFVALPVGMVQAQEGGEVIAEGFNAPQGILVADDGSIYVIDSGLGGDTPIQYMDPGTGQVSDAMIGETARIVQIMPDGTQNEIATLPSVLVGQEAIGGARVAMIDGVLYATSGQWLEGQGDRTNPLLGGIVKIEDGEVTPVADTWAFEMDNNPDGAQLDSHPYGLEVGPDNSLYVADAGANDLLKADPATGSVELVAVFDSLPGVFPNPNRDGEMVTDPVPTGAVFDEDGNAYVSILSGAPFVPGSAKIVKVAPDGTKSDYATGLTMMVDIALAPDGEMYGLQFGQFTDQGPTPNSGAVYHIVEGDGSTSVLEGLSFPTSLGFDDAGDLYLTINGVGAPGSGQVVKYTADSMSGDMAESDDAAMAGDESEGDMAESDDAEMAGDESEGDMAESDDAEMAGDESEGDMAESDMASPETLPMTGASMPNTQIAVLAMLAAVSAGAFIAYRRKR